MINSLKFLEYTDENKNIENLKEIKAWKKAEDLAVRYLKKSGYEIIERNYKTPFGEIDIIVKTKDTYVFVEVKSGSGIRINPSERVDDKKYRKIYKSAEYFINKHQVGKYAKLRIDVVEIVNGNIKHYENIGWDFV